MSLPILEALVAAAARQMPGDALRQFCHGDCGAEYGVNFDARVALARQLWECCTAANRRQAAWFPEMLFVAESILSVPAQTQGAVGEFGCWLGFSSACLSQVCKLVNRKLIVFDSFSGLPEAAVVNHIRDSEEIHYRRGDFAASLESVRAAVFQFGRIEVCEFVPGFFADSLPRRKDDRYVCIFEDADLVSSARTVLDEAWPRLQTGCKFFCHEARDLEVIQLFFDANYWRTRHGIAAPGIVGSGVGLPLCIDEGDTSSRLARLGSCLAYAVKRPAGWMASQSQQKI